MWYGHIPELPEWSTAHPSIPRKASTGSPEGLFFSNVRISRKWVPLNSGEPNAVFSLSGEEAQKGVATHSSGNHAAALALAARMRNIPAYIVMPWTASEIKKKAVAGYGGIITYCEPTLAARESTLAKVVAETGATMIHPYDNLMVIAGQGTAAKEMIEDAGTFDIIMAPVGGGGLLSGTALSAKSLSPGARVIAAEPAGADDAFRSFYAGEIFPSVDPRTIADGLLTSLSERTFTIIMGKVDGIVTVSEEKIVEAMRMVWERMKIIIEPSSAVPLGAILEGKVDVAGVKTGIILSGEMSTWRICLSENSAQPV